jgi:hypothetical protein
MASKFRRAEMSYSSEDEIEQMKGICLNNDRSVSDVLRHAMNVAYGLNWPVPLWRKAESEIKPESVIQREYRAKIKPEKQKKDRKKKTRK